LLIFPPSSFPTLSFYPVSLHDALPIYTLSLCAGGRQDPECAQCLGREACSRPNRGISACGPRKSRIALVYRACVGGAARRPVGVLFFRERANAQFAKWMSCSTRDSG